MDSKDERLAESNKAAYYQARIDALRDLLATHASGETIHGDLNNITRDLRSYSYLLELTRHKLEGGFLANPEQSIGNEKDDCSHQ